MSVKKGINNFKKMQDDKVAKNTIAIENAINNLPKKIEKVSLSKIVNMVSNLTGLHSTTIKKNETYLNLCNEKFLSMAIQLPKNNKKLENIDYERKIRLLELENSTLKNQVISLSNVVSRLEFNENRENLIINDYKEKFEALLNHFKDFLVIKDGEIIDMHSSIRPVIICKLKD